MSGKEAASATIEKGSFGRLATLRLRPNEDLSQAIEAACAEHGITHALVRSCVGSLTDAVLVHQTGGTEGTERETLVQGPGLEIALLNGEIRPGKDGRPRADLRGLVCDQDGRAIAGRFLHGRNPICITIELVLQEWIPEE